jgi:DNA-binding HxlR family transcriptional regulator
MVFAEVPPRVEYTMTEAGYALQPVFHAVLAWASQHTPRTTN